MKSINSFCLAIICLINVNFTFAQNTDLPKDSIYYQSPNKFDLLILSPDYHSLTESNDLQNVLVDFQADLKAIDEKIPTSFSYIIHYAYKEQIEILNNDPKEKFSFSEGKGWVENFRNKAMISNPKSNLKAEIYFDEISVILKADFSEIISEMTKNLPQKTSLLKYLEYQVDEKTNKIRLTQNKTIGGLGMLSIQAGVGANVYKNKFLTDITGELGLHLNRKGFRRNQYYVSNNMVFSFDSENSPIVNNFTNMGYRRNFSSTMDKSNWLGFELGILTKRSSDVFNPNTMRLGINWNLGKNLTIAPQLYFNSFFKEVSPGFRIGIGL
jgi:hypothetical protein